MGWLSAIIKPLRLLIIKALGCYQLSLASTIFRLKLAQLSSLSKNFVHLPIPAFGEEWMLSDLFLSYMRLDIRHLQLMPHAQYYLLLNKVVISQCYLVYPLSVDTSSSTTFTPHDNFRFCLQELCSFPFHLSCTPLWPWVRKLPNQTMLSLLICCHWLRLPPNGFSELSLC